MSHHDDEQPPFEPTGATMEYEPTVVVSESDPAALLDLWRARRQAMNIAATELAEHLQHLAAIEHRIRQVRPDSIKEMGRHLRRLVDDRLGLESLCKDLKNIELHLASTFKAIAARTGIASFPTGYMTISVKDDVSVKYEPAQWDSIIAGLVGVKTTAEAIEALRVAADCGDPGGFDRAVRACIWTGDLGCIQRRFTASKVLEISASSRGLPDGLSLETIPGGKVGMTRVTGSRLADDLPDSL